ncbi:hypothetical protein Tco_1459634, partial [Tanacetum coccineum]
MHILPSRKSILDVICGVVLWSLWNYRNETIFGTSPPRRNTLFDKIVDCSYRWSIHAFVYSTIQAFTADSLLFDISYVEVEWNFLPFQIRDSSIIAI